MTYKDPSFSVCLACAKDSYLRDFIAETRGTGVKCSICNRSDEACSDPNACDDLGHLVLALIRLHYDEWDYNRHFGGDEPESLLCQQNPIWKTESDSSRTRDTDALYDFVYSVVSACPYPPRDQGVGIWAGYNDGEQNPLLKAILRSKSPILDYAERQLLVKNYYDIEPLLQSELAELAPHIRRQVPKDQIFYRARLGYEARYRRFHTGFESKLLVQPHATSNIGAPPPALAGAGRMNRAGVSFLYLASNDKTAAAEIRPHPGHYISVYPFQTNKESTVADFSDVSFLRLYRTDTLLDLFHLAFSIDKALGTPITPEDRHRYNVTQLIADLLRKGGFDGVRFRSSVGVGTNICYFYPEICTADGNQSTVIRTEHLTYEFSAIETLSEITADDFKVS